MDKKKRVYVSDQLFAYVTESRLRREEILECMDLLPFIHQCRLLTFMKAIKMIFEDSNMPSNELRAHFATLVARVSDEAYPAYSGGATLKAPGGASQPQGDSLLPVVPSAGNSAVDKPGTSAEAPTSVSRPASRPAAKKANALGD